MDPGYSIVPARPEHIELLPAIELAAAALLRGHAPDHVLAEVTSLDELNDAQAEGRLWVALEDDSPVGLALIEILDAHTVHLEEVGVHPRHGRRGLGAALVSAVLEWAARSGYRQVTLTTFRDVPWNMPFYARLGFEELPRAEWNPALRAIVEDEAARGLDPGRRVVMVRSLAMTSREPHLFIYLDDQLLATVTFDGFQNEYPWYSGTLAAGPAMPRWREFVDRYAEADVEFDYHPHHPDEGPYEETDLAEYVKLLRELLDARKRGAPPPDGSDEDPWVQPWLAEPIERLEQYIAFLDWRRWRAVTADGSIVEGVPLPPKLHVEHGRFSYRP